MTGVERSKVSSNKGDFLSKKCESLMLLESRQKSMAYSGTSYGHVKTVSQIKRHYQGIENK